MTATYQLVIKDSARSYYYRISNPAMEETGATNPKYIPAIVSFMACAHARKTIPLVPIHPFTKQIVPLVCEELLT